MNFHFCYDHHFGLPKRGTDIIKISSKVSKKHLYYIGYRYIFKGLIEAGSGMQRLINLEIPVIVRSLKSSNVELG